MLRTSVDLLLVLPVIISTILVSGCGRESSFTTKSQTQGGGISQFSGLQKVTPTGSFSSTPSQLKCASACQLTFDPNSNFLSQFSSVNCNGSLTVMDGSLSCTDSLTMTK